MTDHHEPSNAAAQRQSDASLRQRFAHIALAFSMLVTGACGMIYEYTLGVLGNNLMGSSHEQIFVIIGLMMFAMGLGATFQQRIGGNLIDRFLFIEMLLGVLGGISTFVIFSAFALTSSFHLIMYSFALAIGLLIGFEVPILIRINAEYDHSLKRNLSWILSMDYVGSLIGALLFAYFFLTRFSVERISLILGFVNIILAFAGLCYFWPTVKHKILLACGCCSAAVGLAVVLIVSDDWMVHLEQRCFEDPIVHRQTTQYQHLVLTQRRQRTRLFIDGHLQFSSEDERIYHELLVHVPMRVAASRRRVLILGGGDGLALREVLKYGDVEEVTLVDIDPGMIRLASEHPEMIRLNQAAFNDARVSLVPPTGVSDGEFNTIQCPAHSERRREDRSYDLATVRVYTLDADQFLRAATGVYDVAIVDFPDPRSVELAKLYSVDFYAALRKCLTPKSVLAVQSTNPQRAGLVFSCIGKSLQAAGFRCLPYHDHVPSFGEWGWHLGWHDHRTEEEIRNELGREYPIPVNTEYLTVDVVKAAFIFGKNTLATEDPVKPNTKFRPVILAYYRRSFQ